MKHAKSGNAAAAVPSSQCESIDVDVPILLANTVMNGSLCLPPGEPASTVIVMVPGATYDRNYWDFPHEPDTYSFRKAANQRGYATFALDRIGTGKSGVPLAAQIDGILQANAVHEVISMLRNEHHFDKVVLAGHSLGSFISIIEAATWNDTDGVVLTGVSHHINPVGFTELFTSSLYPAALDPKFAGKILDPLYLTTRPGTRYEQFHAPGNVDEQVVQVDEETKSVVLLLEIDSVIASITSYSSRITAPVLLANGQFDTKFCGSFASVDCSTAETLMEAEKGYYSQAASMDTFILPGAGHDINLHPDTQLFQQKAFDWIDSVVAE